MTEPKWKEVATSGSIKPTKVGTYKRISEDGFLVYSNFNGYKWLSYVADYEDAINKTSFSDYQCLDWYDIEEDKPKFEALKFRVKNPEESKLVQEKLFELGYTWSS